MKLSKPVVVAIVVAAVIVLSPFVALTAKIVAGTVRPDAAPSPTSSSTPMSRTDKIKAEAERRWNAMESRSAICEVYFASPAVAESLWRTELAKKYPDDPYLLNDLVTTYMSWTARDC